MSKKQKKKRNKPYAGSGAKMQDSAITRIEAVKRNKLQQWWFEKKPIAKPVSIATGVAILVIWMIVELFQVF